MLCTLCCLSISLRWPWVRWEERTWRISQLCSNPVCLQKHYQVTMTQSSRYLWWPGCTCNSILLAHCFYPQWKFAWTTTDSNWFFLFIRKYRTHIICAIHVIAFASWHVILNLQNELWTLLSNFIKCPHRVLQKGQGKAELVGWFIRIIPHMFSPVQFSWVWNLCSNFCNSVVQLYE